MCQLLIDPKLRHALQTLGVVELRPHQLGAFISIDRGHDVPALLPTGSGKSLLFQLPALLDPPGRSRWSSLHCVPCRMIK